ncbi:MAG: nitroreductase family protein [Anaerolineales bacterium]|nr:nitroreductase family protein [Anaerolineales bacterium]
MLYSIIEISDQAPKDRPERNCDNQLFIAREPLVWLFLADYQRRYDTFLSAGVEQLCKDENLPLCKPEEGDLFLACCDALIAAQNAVIAAEALGLDSCYTGGTMENYKQHKEMFHLPQYVLPITLLCFGYPTQQQKERQQTSRYDPEFILSENQYHRLNTAELDRFYNGEVVIQGQAVYQRKFGAAFSVEMGRSVRAILANWNS